LIVAVEIVPEDPPEEEEVGVPDFPAAGVLVVPVFVLDEPHPAAISATSGTARRNRFVMP
jgi:hypothetical protein